MQSVVNYKGKAKTYITRKYYATLCRFYIRMCKIYRKLLKLKDTMPEVRIHIEKSVFPKCVILPWSWFSKYVPDKHHQQHLGTY